MRILSQILCILLLCSSFGWAKNSIKQKRKSLKEYKTKISKQRTQLKSLSKRERSIHQDLKDFSDKLDKINLAISRIDMEQKETQQRIKKNSKEVAYLQNEIQSKKTQVAYRLRQLYVWGKPSHLRVLLSSSNMREIQERNWLTNHWIEHDQKLIGSYQQNIRELSTKKKKLKEDQDRQKKLKRNRKHQKSILRKEGQAKARLLALVKNQKDYYARSIRELEAASKNLEKLIKTLRRKKSEGKSLFARMRGRLSLPVRGKLEKKYGPYQDTKLKIKLYHKGIDLRARRNSEVRAVFDGKVVYAGWFVGYGKVVIIDHGGSYFTLYAHLSDLLKREDASVVVGEPIGRIGDTGSLKGAYLYFELRHKGISQDPWPWFAKAY